MVTTHRIELWNGKKIIGYRDLGIFKPFMGKFMMIPTISPLKEKYGKSYEVIKVPIIIKEIYNDGIEVRFRYQLDVRRKSKRQIELIKS